MQSQSHSRSSAESLVFLLERVCHLENNAKSLVLRLQHRRFDRLRSLAQWRSQLLFWLASLHP